MITRRRFAVGLGLALGGTLGVKRELLGASPMAESSVEPFLTPYHYDKLILKATGIAGTFDSKSVDDPIVFRHDGAFYMLYIGFDGVGYQTGLAKSNDLVDWKRVQCVARRDPHSKYTQYNVALSSILREKGLRSRGRALKVNGRYLGAWNAYPKPGYEEGAAVIGLAWSDDLLRWELTEPILFPEHGAPWEHGGLYRPDLLLDDGVYYLYYNAKTDLRPKAQGGGWREQTGVATSRDLKQWTRYEGNPILRNGGPGAWDELFASNPYVVRYRDKWSMYYYGLDKKGKARDLLALGDDPYHFTKVNQIIIDTGAPGSVDETYAHKPSVIWHGGQLYHFYCAVSGRWPNEVRGISVARSRPWPHRPA